jgi:hypothetical protein
MKIHTHVLLVVSRKTDTRDRNESGNEDTYMTDVYTKDKGKILSVHAIMAYKGTRIIPPLILNLGTR